MTFLKHHTYQRCIVLHLEGVFVFLSSFFLLQGVMVFFALLVVGYTTPAWDDCIIRIILGGIRLHP